jgi:hypothetical protein
MAADGNMADLFGSDSEEEAPQEDKAQQNGDEPSVPQQGAPVAAAQLFGSSDEEDEQAGPSHPVTQALGEDEDEYRAR